MNNTGGNGLIPHFLGITNYPAKPVRPGGGEDPGGVGGPGNMGGGPQRPPQRPPLRRGPGGGGPRRGRMPGIASGPGGPFAA